ncbi:MAG: hypothetical protein J2P54_20820 [Bradyrhizobiaceae bacterium]|nr:hypothetical protein [Bradyrhizobiaceae bacterium]
MLDSTTDMLAMPIWALAASAALFAAACVLAFVHNAAFDVLRTLLRTSLVFIGVALVAWIIVDRSAEGVRERERRALEARVSDLAIRALTPGSPLACLDAIAGDAVETACEKAVFRNPEVTASAVSYVAARLNLLAYGQEVANRSDPRYASALLALRQSLENDRFGIVAQVLSLRDSCTPAQCDTFALLHDTSRVRANLKDRTFDGYVARYSPNWAVADTSSAPATTGSIGPTRPANAASRIDFPTASSIPAVSIMTPEPETPRASTASPPAVSNAATPQRKPTPHAAAAPTRTTASQSVATPMPVPPPAPSSSPSAEPAPTVQ